MNDVTKVVTARLLSAPPERNAIPMTSTIASRSTRMLARLELDERRLAETNAMIAGIEFSTAYAEYAFGQWETCVLSNPSGCAGEAIIRESDRTPRLTEIGRMLPWLEVLIERAFRVDRLRWARLMRVAGNGCVIAHRDFLEFNQPYTRLHVCLQTNSGAWNSEDRRLFHMEVGEVWHLDATRVHSAACFSAHPRVHLVLDFAGSDDPVSYLARRPTEAPRQPADACRAAMPRRVALAIASLGELLDETNFRDIVAILAKLHFRYDVHTAEMFRWLIEAAERTGDPRLHERAAELERTCILSRPLLSPVAEWA
jgi:hypothetical protein